MTFFLCAHCLCHKFLQSHLKQTPLNSAQAPGKVKLHTLLVGFRPFFSTLYLCIPVMSKRRIKSLELQMKCNPTAIFNTSCGSWTPEPLSWPQACRTQGRTSYPEGHTSMCLSPGTWMSQTCQSWQLCWSQAVLELSMHLRALLDGSHLQMYNQYRDMKAETSFHGSSEFSAWRHILGYFN